MVIYKIVIKDEKGSDVYPRIFFDEEKAKEFCRNIQRSTGWGVVLWRGIPDEEKGFFQDTNQVEF